MPEMNVHHLKLGNSLDKKCHFSKRKAGVGLRREGILRFGSGGRHKDRGHCQLQVRVNDDIHVRVCVAASWMPPATITSNNATKVRSVQGADWKRKRKDRSIRANERLQVRYMRLVSSLKDTCATALALAMDM